MKNFLSIFSVEALKENLLRITKRFPISVLLILVLATLFFVNLHWDFWQDVEFDIFRAIFSVIVTFFLSLWIYFTFEDSNFSKLGKNLYQVFVLLFWILFFYQFSGNIDNIDNIVYFILTLVWIISYLFIAPYVKILFNEKNKQEVYYSYFYKISVVFLTSYILWLVLFGLWSIAILVTFKLFDITSTIDTEKIYWDWAIISLSIIAPVYALINLPKQDTFEKDDFIQNAFFSFLVKYIATPFIYVYFIILYAYSLKVLLNFSTWPKWEVSWMVIWFSSFGYLIYIFSYIFEETNKFIKFYRKVFPFVVIPQLFMLFYAIYLRIAQYDITINRYFVVVFGIWLVVISLYFVFSKAKKLSFIPLILTIFTIIISVWPWWVYKLPESRQLIVLKNNLIKSWILKNGEIYPLKNYEDISQDLSKSIYSEIEYLCKFNNCESIKKILPKQYEIVEKKHNEDLARNKIEKSRYNDISSWEIISGITEQIKVKWYYEKIDDLKTEILNFSIDPEKWIFPMDLMWYNTLIRIWYDFEKVDTRYNHWIINIASWTIDIVNDWKIIDRIPTKDITDKLFQTYKITKKLNLEKIDLTFDIKNYKIIFENISIKNPLYIWKSSNTYYYANGYILIK